MQGLPCAASIIKHLLLIYYIKNPIFYNVTAKIIEKTIIRHLFIFLDSNYEKDSFFVYHPH